MSQRRDKNFEKFKKYEGLLASHAADVVKKHKELNSLEQMLAHPQPDGILNRLRRFMGSKPVNKQNFDSHEQMLTHPQAKIPLGVFNRFKNMVSKPESKPQNKQMFDSLGTSTSGIRKLPIVNNSMRQQTVAARHRDALRLIERTESKIPQNTQANFNSQADKLEEGLKDMDHLGKGNENDTDLNNMLNELGMPITTPKKTTPKKYKDIDLPDDLFTDDLIDGGRRNTAKKPTAKKPTKLNRGADMNMKDIRGLCKVNQIKLSKTKDGVRVIYTKKELITKLKRKKIL